MPAAAAAVLGPGYCLVVAIETVVYFAIAVVLVCIVFVVVAFFRAARVCTGC